MIWREGMGTVGPRGEPRSPWEGFASSLTVAGASILVVVLAVTGLALPHRPELHERVTGEAAESDPSPLPVEVPEGPVEILEAAIEAAEPAEVVSSALLTAEEATGTGSSVDGTHRSPRTALIVGINRARGGAHLQGSITDARNVEKAVGLYGFAAEDVSVLLEGEATRGAILDELDRLAARTAPDGVAVFAVATHTRIRRGVNELLTADGLRISAHELAGRLGKVPAKTLVLLPTCYAGGYDIPGITGPGRLAIFASSARSLAYQQGTAGSYLVQYVVGKAMVEGHAPGTVQQSFRYAEERLRRERPNRVPIMSDGIGHDLVLGTWGGTPPDENLHAAEPGSEDSSPDSSPGWRQSPPSEPSNGGGRICTGPVRLRCRS